MGLADGECLVSGFDEHEAVFHRRAGSELLRVEVPRIETRPTGQERPAILGELAHLTVGVELLMLQIGSLDAVTEEEDLDGMIRIQRGVRETEPVLDLFRIVCFEDDSEVHNESWSEMDTKTRDRSPFVGIALHWPVTRPPMELLYWRCPILQRRFPVHSMLSA